MTSTGEAPSGGVNRSLTARTLGQRGAGADLHPGGRRAPSRGRPTRCPLYSTMRTGKPIAARGPRRRSDGRASAAGRRLSAWGSMTRQQLVEALERHRLADEVERAQAQAFAGLGLGGDARDGHDRQTGLADGTQLRGSRGRSCRAG